MVLYSQSFNKIKEKEVAQIKRENDKNKILWYDYCKDYFVNTSLHGLRYIGCPQISLLERISWVLCFCSAVVIAGYFVSIIYVVYDKNPVIITMNHIPTSISEIPFPAITVCSVNKAKKSTVQPILDNGTDLEKSILANLCAQKANLNVTQDVQLESSKWENVLKFILKVAPSCGEMLKYCSWRSQKIDCDKWFNPTITDEGLCCTFNQMPNAYIFRDKDNFNELSYNYPSLVDDWTQEKGYDKNAPLDVFPWRPRGSGENMGLTLVLDAAIEDYYCSSTNGVGFKVLLHNPLEVPILADFGRIILLNRENWYEIETTITETKHNLRSIPIKKRRCYFNEDKYLRFFRTYTQGNCKLECLTNYSLKMCDCIPHYLPHDKDAEICGFEDLNCTLRAEVIMEATESRNGSGSLDATKTGTLNMARTSGSEKQEAVEGGHVESLEDAQKLIRELRQKTRAQAQQILAWRRAYKMQEALVCRLHKEKADQLKILSSKLLLFESRLIRKQKDISILLNHRETIIQRQQRIIETLTNRLVDNGLEPPHNDLTELDTNLLDLDSLNDSDSAVVMEDIDSDSNVTHIPRFRSGNSDGVTVMRSISDAIDPNLKYTARRSNGFLRRPEILETVYSVEEDADNENQPNENKSEANKKRDAFASQRSEKAIYQNEEAANDKSSNKNRLPATNNEVPGWPYSNNTNTDTTEETEKPANNSNQVTTYNRVMSNHRSVTKPKDVKYKRINKAKSKSLEELRGRLKNWVEQGGKLTGLTLEHSQSYA